MIAELAIADAAHVHDMDRNPSTGRWDAGEFGLLRTSHDDLGGDHVTLGELGLDLDVEIRERLQHLTDKLLRPLLSLRLTGPRDVLHEVVSEEAVDGINVTVPEDFVVELLIEPLEILAAIASPFHSGVPDAR